jgi:predicted HAD superfamily Cof-like phosphohydrolase
MYLRDVGAFQAKFGLDGVEAAQPGFILDNKLQGFRLNFLLEELMEYAEAVGFELVQKGDELVFAPATETQARSLVGALDALVDLQYVLTGNVRFHGFAVVRYDPILSQTLPVFDSAWYRVHAANMRKVRSNGTGKRGSTFDVVKPEGWVPPNLKDLLA